MASDWEKFFLIKCSNCQQAIRIERHIKNMKSRRYLENLVLYPEITERLLKRYK
jgi:putative endonuclease